MIIKKEMIQKACVVLLSVIGLVAESQVLKFDSIISENQITTYQNQNLILIDFWATWCAPCLPATKQLEIIQESFPDDVFMVSLSDESNRKISRFINKKPIKLMVASDLKYNNIKKYNVRGRPYAVLLNNRGHKLWEGKPGDLTENVLKRYIRMESSQSNRKVKFKKLFGTQDEYKRSHPKKVNPKIREIIIDNLGANKKVSYQFTGTLQSFLSEYKAIPKLLFNKNPILNKEIGVIIPDSLNRTYSKIQIADTVLSKLNLEEQLLEIDMDVFELQVMDPTLLWDTSQINWGQGSPPYLLGDVSLEADNVSLKKLAGILSNAKDDLYTYVGADENLYDFSFIYSDIGLMKTDLENIGIQIVRKQSKISVHSFYPKEQSLRIE